MGDPKKQSNKFQKPMHPWNKARLEQEKPLMQKYGLESKSELWKITSTLKTFKQNAKRLVALKGAQAEKEREQMFERLRSFGLAQTGSVDDILGLKPEQLLDRRLQTIVFKKGLARTTKQARQMITHRHITINGRKITAPGYLVRINEEHSVEFYPGSKFFSEDHPERPPREKIPGRSETNVPSKEEKPEKKAEKKESHDKKEVKPRKAPVKRQSEASSISNKSEKKEKEPKNDESSKVEKVEEEQNE